MLDRDALDDLYEEAAEADWTPQEVADYEAELEFDYRREQEGVDQMTRAGIDEQTPVDTFIKMNGDSRYVTEL